MDRKVKIDWSGVLSLAQSIIDSIESGNYHEDNDDAEYIYEAVMQAIYGDGFWQWFNEKTDEPS